MTETMGVDIGTQILNAVQGLAVRMDRLEARMDGLETRMGRLEARMDKLEARMDRLEARMDGLESRVDKLEARMDGLEAQVTDLKTQVTDLDSRMRRQERLLEGLGAESLKWHDGLRGEVLHLRGDVQRLSTDMYEGFRRLNARLDLTDGAVVLLAAVLRRPRELGEDLEKRLRELQAH